ncbi:MAG: prolipoprotein diacylglyceryl transferase [Planctomycetes bacterium]|nr:prolipoprotein diacylglyceryl transferase [Planctomycetota bacterium]
MRSVLFKIPLPEFLGLGEGIPVFGYGLMILLAWLTSDYWARKRAEQFSIEGEHVQSITISALVAGIIGARLTHFILYPDGYESFIDFFKIYEGGLVLYGFLITTPAIIYYKLRSYKISWNQFFVIFAPVIPLGIGIGRLGCFLNGCCYGTHSDMPWCVHFPQGSLAHSIEGLSRHPSQIYAFFLGLGLSIILAKTETLLPKPKGIYLALSFLFGYGLIRLIEENFRGDTPAHVGGILTAGQGISILLMLSACITFVALKFRRIHE